MVLLEWWTANEVPEYRYDTVNMRHYGNIEKGESIIAVYSPNHEGRW